jgi:predicted dehydrogenase
VLAIERGLKVLLEKPVAASMEDMTAMWRSYNENSGEVVVGFCLRYAPFYQRIKEIVESGRLGRVLQINAEELMSDELSMAFARGDWRPNPQRSGGMLLEKCCHDMDIIGWLVGSQAKAVFSFAQRSYLTARDDVGPRCKLCPIKDKCRFTPRETVKAYETEWPSELHEVLAKLDDDGCPYSQMQTYPDHQSVSVSFENEVLCNFSVTQVQSATRRTIHVLGSEARLYGVLSDNSLTIYRRINSYEERSETITVHPDRSGHNGGDSVLTNDFFALLNGEPRGDRPGLQEGIEAALLCIAADESARRNKAVELDKLRQEVFAGKFAHKPVGISAHS